MLIHCHKGILKNVRTIALIYFSIINKAQRMEMHRAVVSQDITAVSGP